ncbi:dolichyl-phosphate-mannose--protein mannosyltransferase [Microbacterium jejuense]|uniref:dolichyl-phosphate-mannose--protein mannosyltransferase n=1 Tax=Microbacterium jejuense TaxID=1263637 RepID=UPI0031EAC9BB
MTDAPRLEADQPAAPLLPPPRPTLYDRFATSVAASPRAQRLYRWLGPALVVVLAGILRLWNLGAAHDLMNQFDETYYVKDAWSMLHLGYEGSWPSDGNASFLAGDPNVFTSNPSFVVHPPLGKWIIGLGMLVLGPESGWGWRITTALLGTASVLLLMLIAKRLTRSTTFAVVAGLLMAVDGLAISMSRIALLDTSLTFFVLLAILFVIRDRERTMTRIAATVAARYDGDEPPSWGPILWNRPWLIAAGAALGAASAVKWSGAWVLAGLGVYLVVTDALARRRAGVVFWPTDAVRQGLATFVLFVPVALGVYLASWTGWLVTDGGYDRQSGSNALQSLWLYHEAMYRSTSQITSGHTYASPAWQWPLLVRPTGVYWHHDAFGVNGCEAANGCSEVISTIPNPLIWYAGVAAVLYLAYRFFRTRDWRYALVLTGVAVTYVPWLFLPARTVFQFYTVLILPFMLLALTFALRDIAGPPDATAYRRTTGQRLVIVFLGVALALSAFWYPVISAMDVTYDFWHLHAWMNSWI